MDPAVLFGNLVGLLTVPWLTARETAALIVVALSLLFFRVFRERCLLLWGAGWVAYGVFLWATSASELLGASKSMTAFAQADFVLAMALFAAAALLSAQLRRALTALMAVSWVLIVCAAMRPLYFPDTLYFLNSPYFLSTNRLGLGLEVACRLMAATAAVALLRYRWGVLGWGHTSSALAC